MIDGQVNKLNLTWNYTNITPQKIYIRLNFSEPLNISQYALPDRLFVLLNLHIL